MSTQEITVTTEITPALMAKAFWDMSCEEQAEFFAELAKLTKDDLFHAQTQWLWMAESIKESGNKDAVTCFLSFTAFAYDYWPQKTESQFMGVTC